MFYIIIPITAGDDPQSWYAYLLRVGPITIFLKKPEPTDQQLLLRIFLNDCAVHHLGDAQVFNKKEMMFNFSFILQEQLRLELCENSETLSMQRLTTNFFYHNAWRLNFDYRDQSLIIGNTKYYLLSSGLFKCPPVSISRNPEGREILYFDEDSPTLRDCYEALFKIGLHRNFDDLMPNLECLSRFVRGVFASSDLKKVAEIIADERNQQVELAWPTPTMLTAVNLALFIDKGVGVCRHNAMLVCFLLLHMIRDGWLPEAEIIQFRMKMPKGMGHSFVLFRTPNHHEIYVVDSALNQVFCLPRMHTKFTQRYSQEIYAQICTQYLIKESQDIASPTQIISSLQATPLLQYTPPMDDEKFELSQSMSKL